MSCDTWATLEDKTPQSKKGVTHKPEREHYHSYDQGAHIPWVGPNGIKLGSNCLPYQAFTY